MGGIQYLEPPQLSESHSIFLQLEFRAHCQRSGPTHHAIGGKILFLTMKTILPASLLLFLAGCSPQGPDTSAKESNAVGSVVRLDPALDALIPPEAKIEKIASGFKFTEGPLWKPNGVLWFSDVVGNVVRQWSPEGKAVEILNPGGADNAVYAPPGSFIGPNG